LPGHKTGIREPDFTYILYRLSCIDHTGRNFCSSTTRYIQLKYKTSLTRSNYEQQAMSTPTTSRRSPGPVVPGRRYRAQREVVDVSRPGKRIQCLGIGAALVPLAAVGILLLNDHLSVANATATSMESDKSAVLAHTQVTVAGNSSINSGASIRK